jgi:hypothetical protein
MNQQSICIDVVSKYNVNLILFDVDSNTPLSRGIFEEGIIILIYDLPGNTLS